MIMCYNISMNRLELLEQREQGKTYREIGKMYGLSGQRVQQLLGPPPSIRDYIIRKYNRLCVDCGAKTGLSGHIHHKNSLQGYDDIDNLILLCKSCHAKRHNPKAPVEPKKPTVVSVKTILTCSQCGKTFCPKDGKARKRRNISGTFFCSKHCQGKYLGRYRKPRK